MTREVIGGAYILRVELRALSKLFPLTRELNLVIPGSRDRVEIAIAKAFNNIIYKSFLI